MNTDPLLSRRRSELHALGHQLFGKRWNVARHTLVGMLTDFRTNSSTDLSVTEIEQMIADLRQRRMVDAIKRGEQSEALLPE